MGCDDDGLAVGPGFEVGVVELGCSDGAVDGHVVGDSDGLSESGLSDGSEDG